MLLFGVYIYNDDDDGTMTTNEQCFSKFDSLF